MVDHLLSTFKPTKPLISFKYLLLLGLLSQVACADDTLFLKRGQIYTVPDGVTWEIRNTPIADCKVCTSDIYIKGESSQVEIDGIVFFGELEFSIKDKNHSKIIFYPSTEIWLGDSRETLQVVPSKSE